MTTPDQCYICAADLSPSLAKCAKCGVEVAWLQSVPGQAKRQRFLFGQVQQPELEPAQKAAPVTKPKPRVRKRKAAEPKPAAPMPASMVEMQKPDVADMIRNRDAEFEQLEKQSGGTPFIYWLAIGLDGVICLLCGLIMVFGAQLLTNRDIDQLFTYSLMPMAFAFMSFSFLYYCLFWILLRQTPGMIMIGAEREKAT